jgi:hypothetical protein
VGGGNVKPRLTPNGKFALILIACEFALFGISLAFGKPTLGLSACVCAGVLLAAIRSTWALHEHVWYWIAVAISAAMQLPLMLYLPWSNHAYWGTALLVFGILDYVAVWGCIMLAEKTMRST